MFKGQIDTFEYKIILLKNGDQTNSINLTNSISTQSSKQGVNLENDKFDLEFNLLYELKTINDKEYMSHQFTDELNNGIIYFTKKDVIRVYIKRSNDNVIDVNSRDDLLAEYFVQNWSISPLSHKLTLTLVDINYKIYNRLFDGTYGRKDGGTYTSIGSNTLSDTTKTWSTNQWQNKTLEMTDGDGVIYNYLIISNDSDTLTLHKNLDSGILATYGIGDSSANIMYESMLRVTPFIEFNGEYKLSVSYSTDYGSDYRNGIQLLRVDGYALPITDYSQARKAYHKMIGEVSSINALNTTYEINNDSYTIDRDFILSTTYDTELDKYRVDWFYSKASELLLNGNVTGNTSSTVTDTSLSLSTDEYKGQLMRINNKSYDILSNASDTFTLTSSSLNDEIEIGDSYNVYADADFIWDNNKDYRHIYDYKASNKTDNTVNHILFSCGKNEMNGEEITGHRLNSSKTITDLTETYIPMTWISKEVLVNDNRRQSDGSYEYPSYPHTIINSNSQPYPESDEVSSDTDYNQNLRDICRGRAYRLCESLFQNMKEGQLKCTFVVRGNRYFQAGNSAEKGKIYDKGSVILFKDVANGIYNPDHPNGYYILRVDTIRHQISSGDWRTTLDVSYDIYSEKELTTL